MRCRVEITDSTPREEYIRPVEYHNYTEPGESRRVTPVKVTAIQAQRKVWLGGEVPVYVTVVNYVSHEKVVDVILQDYTNNVFIGKSQVVIPPQSSKTVTFQWKTRGFSLGEHVLHAEAITDPEPYYEYDSVTTERVERTDRPGPERERTYVRRKPDGEIYEIVSEAEDILRRVEQEWEDASRARDRAATEAEHIIAEADEQAKEQSRNVEGKANAIIDDAFREADDIVQEAEMVKKQAEDYRHRVENETMKVVEDLEEECRTRAESEALEIKEAAMRSAEELLAEVQKQLEAARMLREMAKDLADIAGFDTTEAEDTLEALTDRISDYHRREIVKEEKESEVEEFRPIQPQFDLSDEEAVVDTPPDETETDSAENRLETDDESRDDESRDGAGEVDDAPDTDEDQGANRRNFFRWQNIIMAVSLVAAAVLLSYGLISLG